MSVPYVRDAERFDVGFPSIRGRAGLIEPPGRRGLTTIEDSMLNERNGRFISSAPCYHSRDPEREAAFYPRPPSPNAPGRKQILELQDQLKFYREELAKKDRLVTQLASVETPRPRGFDNSRIEEIYATDRITASAAAQSELAALHVKVDGLNSQLREMQSQLDAREDKVRELRLQVETSRESEAKQAAMVHSLRQKLVEYETQYGSLEGAANRSELAINTLQRENNSAQERIIELESRLKTHLEERERAEQEKDLAAKRWNDLVIQISGVLRVDDTAGCSPMEPECLFSRITELIHESALLKSKLASMKEYVSTAEIENKASRETIMRLVSEAEREQKFASRYTVEMDNLKLERDNAVASRRELEREIELLKERLDSTQRAWTATKHELENRDSHYNSADREIRESKIAVRNAEVQYKSFKEALAALLSDSYSGCEPYEEAIRERIKNLMLNSKDRGAHLEMLESKVTSLTNQLDGQYELQRTADRKAKQAEVQLLDMEDRLRRAESELCAGDVLRDGMRGDKNRYLRFLERITMALKMEPLAADMGMDMACDAIISRADQLMNMEAGGMAERKTHIYNLQRKVKSLKEQLESKDVHMDLLRKKVAGLEERLLGKSELEREKDEDYVKNRKLFKLVEKYKIQLNEARLEIQSLKARLLETSEIQTRTLEQERELENLEAKVGQLEHVRQKQALKITGMKDQMDEKEQVISQRQGATQNTIQALTSELRTTKIALDDITKRERQLLDLRQVIARMLGLDINSLAIPDYEIISRLEKLILANSTNAATAIALDSALEDVGDGFRAGYNDASRALAATAIPVIPPPPRTGPTMSRRMHTRTRSRSLSPTRKRDTRAY